MLRLVNGAAEFVTVEEQEGFQGRVAHALVPIHEWMVHDEGKTERGGLGGEIGIEVVAAERHARLGYCRLQGAQVAKPAPTARLVEEALMQREDFGEGEVPHLGQAAV